MKWLFTILAALAMFSCGGAETKNDKFQEIRDRANDSQQDLNREENRQKPPGGGD
jgi:hypothetical protein